MAIKFRSPFVKVENEETETTEPTHNVVADVVTGKPTREVLSKAGKKVKDAQVGSRLGFAFLVVPANGAIKVKETASKTKQACHQKAYELRIDHYKRSQATEQRRQEKENQVEVVEVVTEQQTA